MEKILSGNLDDQVSSHSETRGWVLGAFMDKYPDYKSDEVELKWARHKKSEIKQGLRAASTTKTFVILLEGVFRLKFPYTGEEILMSKLGDYTFYDAAACSHEGEALEDCLVLVIRWPSVKAA